MDGCWVLGGIEANSPEKKIFLHSVPNRKVSFFMINTKIYMTDALNEIHDPCL